MQTIAIKEQLQDLQELLQGKSKTNGWQMFAQPNVILESLGRDEFKLNESKVWPNFTDRQEVPLQVTGFFLVPGKILVAVA